MVKAQPAVRCRPVAACRAVSGCAKFARLGTAGMGAGVADTADTAMKSVSGGIVAHPLYLANGSACEKRGDEQSIDSERN